MRGLNIFLDFAFTNSGVKGKIICPYQKCKFKKWQSREEVYDHLIIKPFPKGHTVCLLHGKRRVNDEASQVMAKAPQVMAEEDGGRVEINDNICEMINDVFADHCFGNDTANDDEMGVESSHTRSHDGTNFFELMQDEQQTKIPNSFYEAKKVINKLGLHYTKIDACPELRPLLETLRHLLFSPRVEAILYAVVTGANKGIGFGVCKKLASSGVVVVLTVKDEERGLKAIQTLKEFGLSDLLVFHQLDVDDPASVATLAHFIKTKFGKLDILIAFVGVEVLLENKNLVFLGTSREKGYEPLPFATGNTIYTKQSRGSTNHKGVAKGCPIYFIQEFENALASFPSTLHFDAAWAFDVDDRWPPSDACLFLGQNPIC
ncbi:hypothetical protein V8G54_035026 [Vigna mungo]|uniref:Transposase-associated domain-containing protein n=1 Tax=Vigna mungo TaxID=3915 RepID=A0AAQ3MEB0_VIGMU